MTVVKVKAGACGFVTRIWAEKKDKREVNIRIESDCESVNDLGLTLREMGPLNMKDVLSKGQNSNKVFRAALEKLPHSACPITVAILKACEVELGLAVPRPVSIEFKSDSESSNLDLASAMSNR
ncbi:MAG: DUF6951 family protein [Desulfomonilaceae bacterium]